MGLFGGDTTVETAQDIIVAVEANPDVQVAVPPVDLRPIALAQASVGDRIAAAIRRQTQAVAVALGHDADTDADQAAALRDVGLAAVAALLAWTLSR